MSGPIEKLSLMECEQLTDLRYKNRKMFSTKMDIHSKSHYLDLSYMDTLKSFTFGHMPQIKNLILHEDIEELIFTDILRSQQITSIVSTRTCQESNNLITTDIYNFQTRQLDISHLKKLKSLELIDFRAIDVLILHSGIENLKLHNVCNGRLEKIQLRKYQGTTASPSGWTLTFKTNV